MGFLRDMKDMKKTVEAAPGMVAQARELGAQAQQMAAAQQAASAQAQAAAMGSMGTGSTTISDTELAPIAGVSLELYADISKGLAAYGYDQSKAVEVAASKGVSAESWQEALDGWNARITANRAIGARFNALYRAG